MMDKKLFNIANALTRSGQPETSFAAVAHALAQEPGYRLCTVLIHNPAQNLVRRAWSSHPDVYPVGGTKPLVDEPWVKPVLIEGKPHLARDPEDLRRVFFDSALIASLGCGSTLNLPVSWDGSVIGSFNISHEAHYYDSLDLSSFQPLIQLAVPAMLQAMG